MSPEMVSPCRRRRRPVRATVVPFAAAVALALVVGAGPLGPGLWDARPVAAQPPPAVVAAGEDQDGGEPDDADEEPPPDPLEAARPAIRAEIRRLDAIVRGAGERREEAAAAIQDATELTGELDDLRANALPVAIEAAEESGQAATDARRLAAGATRKLADARQRLTEVTLGLYMAGPVEQLDLASNDPLNRFRTSQSVRTGITELRSRVASARQAVDDTRAEAERTAAVARQAREELAALQQQEAQLEARIAELIREASGALAVADGVVGATASAQASIVGMLAGAGSPANGAADPSVSILGDPVLTAPQLVSWFASQSVRAGVDELAELFISEGRDLGVRGDIAFIQAVLETGGFQFTGSHNYAGVGHCDSCPRGYAFASAREGVRAQLQLLRAYADPDVTADDLPGGAVAPINVSSLGVRGCCASWWGLSGVWASALHYGGTILMMYESALAHAAAR